MRADSLSLIEDLSQLSSAPQVEFSLSSRYVRGTLSFCLKWNGPREALTQKKASFNKSGLNSGSSFISQDEGMYESSVETLEKAVGVRLIWTGALISI